MPNPKKANMESMSESYMAALCARNGYTMNVDSKDYDGIDLTIKCPDFPDEHQVEVDDLMSPVIEVQLKSTYSDITFLEDGSLSYALKVHNYNELVPIQRVVPRILVLLVMYEDEIRWLNHTINGLTITKCAYWLCLQGQPESNNKETVNVHFPSNQVLTPEELKRIMIKVSKGEPLC